MLRFEIPTNGYGSNYSSLKKDQMIISQNKALDLHKSSHLMTLGKMKTPMDSIVTLL